MAKPSKRTSPVGTMVPWGDIPEGGVTPAAYYLGVVHLTPKLFDDGRRIVEGEFDLKEPEGCQVSHRHTFWVGNDKDPLAEDPNTWKQFPGQQLKKLVMKSGIEPEGKGLEEVCDEVDGQEVILKVTIGTIKKGERKGEPANRTDFLAVGEAETGWMGDEDSPGLPAKPKKKVKKREPAPDPDEEESEEEDEEDED